VWCNKFKVGRTALNNDPEKQKNGQRTSHTDENYIIVEGLIREDPGVKVRHIAEVTGIADLNFYEVSAC
jgi:hypothetical protein